MCGLTQWSSRDQKRLNAKFIKNYSAFFKLKYLDQCPDNYPLINFFRARHLTKGLLITQNGKVKNLV